MFLYNTVAPGKFMPRAIIVMRRASGRDGGEASACHGRTFGAARG